MAPKKQPSPSAEPQVLKDPRETLIRLNDLIPKRDVSGGRRAVFGAVPSASGKIKKKEQN